MGNSRKFKITSPAIVYKDRESEPIGKMLIKGLCSSVERSNDKGEKFSLKRPEPSFLPVDFHAGLILTIKSCIFSPFTDEFICGNGFFGDPVNCFYQCTFTDRRMKHISEYFGQPLKGNKLTDAQIGCKGFNVFSVADPGRDAGWKISNHGIAACACSLKCRMFDKNRFYHREDNFLTTLNQRWLNMAYITTTTGAELRNMFNNLIRLFNHFKGGAFVTRLSARFFTTGFL